MAVRKKTVSDPSDPNYTAPVSDEGTEPSSPDTATPVKRRRRRRTTTSTTDLGETAALVAALLRTRGVQGATQDDLQHVVVWARNVRDEGDALHVLASRPRRQKSQAPTERVTRYEMNRALLDGVLAGSIALDVQEGSGTLLFLNEQHLAARQASSENAMESTPTVFGWVEGETTDYTSTYVDEATETG